MSLHALNLSLASSCSALCTFCPIDVRGARITAKVMPTNLALRLLDEAAMIGVSELSFGENGDGLYQRDFLDILRHARRMLPQATMRFFTNLIRLVPATSAAIIDEQLLDHVYFNIDGSSKERYEAMKGLPYDRIWAHLRAFLKRRNDAGSPLIVTGYMLSETLYDLEIRRQLGKVPLRPRKYEAVDPNVEFKEILEKVEPLLRRPSDAFYIDRVFGWAERKQFDGEAIDYTGMACPLLSRVKHEAFIAPDGTWYACCYDANNEQVMGNVSTHSLQQISQSLERHNFIKQLEAREFEALGGPCRTVNCCGGKS